MTSLFSSSLAAPFGAAATFKRYIGFAALTAGLLVSSLVGASAVSASELIYAYNDRHDGYTSHHIHIRDLETGADKVVTPASGAAWNAAFAPSGDWIVYTLQVGEEFQVFRADADGSNARQLTHEPGLVAFHPMVSPDGSKIAFSGWDAGDVMLMNADGTGLQAIASHDAFDYYPVFLADSSAIMFGSRRMVSPAGAPGIFLYDLKTGATHHTGLFGNFARPSHDGKSVVYGGIREKGQEPDIYIAPLDGDDDDAPAPMALTSTVFYEGQPVFTKDDSQILFVGRAAQTESLPEGADENEAGVNEVFIIDRDGRNMKRLTLGNAVAWHPELKE